MKKIFVIIFLLLLLILGFFLYFNYHFSAINKSSYASENGYLKVENTDIVNENGNKFQLKGLSSSRYTMDF